MDDEAETSGVLIDQDIQIRSAQQIVQQQQLSDRMFQDEQDQREQALAGEAVRLANDETDSTRSEGAVAREAAAVLGVVGLRLHGDDALERMFALLTVHVAEFERVGVPQFTVGGLAMGEQLLAAVEGNFGAGVEQPNLGQFLDEVAAGVRRFELVATARSDAFVDTIGASLLSYEVRPQENASAAVIQDSMFAMNALMADEPALRLAYQYAIGRSDDQSLEALINLTAELASARSLTAREGDLPPSDLSYSQQADLLDRSLMVMGQIDGSELDELADEWRLSRDLEHVLRDHHGLTEQALMCDENERLLCSPNPHVYRSGPGVADPPWDFFTYAIQPLDCNEGVLFMAGVVRSEEEVLSFAVPLAVGGLGICQTAFQAVDSYVLADPALGPLIAGRYGQHVLADGRPVDADSFARQTAAFLAVAARRQGANGTRVFDQVSLELGLSESTIRSLWQALESGSEVAYHESYSTSVQESAVRSQ